MLDGAPAAELCGLEIKSEFVEIGYELFIDRDTFGAHSVVADLFDANDGSLREMHRKVDTIQLTLFLHIFDLATQLKACSGLVTLLKNKKG